VLETNQVSDNFFYKAIPIPERKKICFVVYKIYTAQAEVTADHLD